MFSLLSCKSIKDLSHRTDYSAEYLKDYIGLKKLTKSDIIKELNTLDIKYRSNMKCDELMTLLMKGK